MLSGSCIVQLQQWRPLHSPLASKHSNPHFQHPQGLVILLGSQLQWMVFISYIGAACMSVVIGTICPFWINHHLSSAGRISSSCCFTWRYTHRLWYLAVAEFRVVNMCWKTPFDVQSEAVNSVSRFASIERQVHVLQLSQHHVSWL